MLCLQIVGMLYETEEGLGGGEEGDDGPDDNPDHPEEPDKETNPAPPPDHDPDDDDQATIILDDEGNGGEEEPGEEGAGGGHVDPVGATGTTPASVSSEVVAAINQARLVSEGLAPPAKTINIAPLPGFQSLAPQVVPSTAGLPARRALSQQDRVLIKNAVGRVLGSQRHSSRSHGPASSSSGTPRTPALPQPPPQPPQQLQLPSPKARPSPCPLVGAGYPLPCQLVAEWASLLQVSPCPPRRGSQILLWVCGVTNGGSRAGLISLGLPPLCNSGRPTAFSGERASGSLLEFAISVRGAQGDQLPSPA